MFDIIPTMGNPDNNVERKQNQSVTLVIFHGPPGAGKDTGIDLWKKDLISNGIYTESEICSISTGDIIRNARKQGEGEIYNVLRNEKHDYFLDMDEGKLLPNEIVADIFVKRVKEMIKAGVKLMPSSGYPRNIEQQKSLDRAIETVKNEEGIDISVVNVEYEVPDEICMERVVGRSVVEGRTDDTLPVARKRLDIHHINVDPLLKILKEDGNLIIIDGRGDKYEVARVTFETLSFIKPNEKIHTRNGMVF